MSHKVPKTESGATALPRNFPASIVKSSGHLADSPDE